LAHPAVEIEVLYQIIPQITNTLQQHNKVDVMHKPTKYLTYANNAQSLSTVHQQLKRISFQSHSSAIAWTASNLHWY